MKNIILQLILLCIAAGLKAQCLSITTCSDNQQVCDLTTNNGFLWNETTWWDNVNQTHDLPETPCDLSSIATDTCSGTSITAKYLLFLDLNGDDTLETVIKSWDLPAPGTVNYNNYNNPNYDGGELRIFDERPVPANQKYQFALETVLAGNTLTARLRWSTPVDPGTFTLPELPYGAHKIQWIFDDNLSNQTTCDQHFLTKDCKKPTVVCINGLSVNIMPTQQISLWASDFLQYADDNATPNPLLEYAIRKSNTGTGFPVDGNGDPIHQVTFNCSELGTQLIELWARDAAGNADYCETYVIVQDNLGNCNGSGGPNAAPTVQCLNGLSVHLNGDGTVHVTASSLLNAAYDDITPPNLLELSLRRAGTGTGFPVDGQGNPVSNLLYETADLGVNTIDLWARDQDGNADYCETYIIVQENQGGGSGSPTVVCLNGLSVNVMPTGLIQLWATDFLQYVEDDNTPTPQIQLGIRRSGTGTGFPVDGQGNPITSVTYTCDEQGTQPIELWAKDLDGNADYCETYVLVQDNGGFCGGLTALNQTVCVKRWCDGAVVSDVQLVYSGTPPGLPPFEYYVSGMDINGCMQIDSALSPLPLSNITITVAKDDDSNNGVTPLDLVKISRHILGLEPLTSYAIIAADVNKSNSVTTFDIVESRKLIQGIYQEFPSNTSWRFVSADYDFPNPNNPFQGAFPETVTIANIITDSLYNTAFVAVKIGDVDCDATPGATAPAEDRQVEFLTIPDATLEAGETVEIPISFADAGAWLAMQAGLTYDPQQLEIEAITPGNLPGLEKDAFAEPTPGILNLVWYTPEPFPVSAGEKIATLHLRARQSLQLSKTLQLTRRTPETPRYLQAEGYDAGEKASNFQLLFRDSVIPGSSNQNIIFQAQPNPTTNAARIPIRLAEAETVRLTLTDVSGKLIWHQEQALPAGMQELEIPALALPETGVYFWKVQAGETVASGKLIKCR